MKIENLKFKIIFFGASSYVLPIVEMLKSKFALERVVTTEKLGSDPLIKFCIQNKIPYSFVSSKNELLKLVNSKSSIVNAQLGIVADFGIIIPREILDQFTHGILNIHPSLLPKYRGPTPVQAAILNGDKTTGVTIIKLDEHMDHGPIIEQFEEKISNNDTFETLIKRLFEKTSMALEHVITRYNKDQKAHPQDHSKATFTKLLKRDDGFVDISYIPPVEKLDRMIKAFYPWPGVWTRLRLSSGGEAKIVKFLPNKKIQVEGKKQMSYKDFLNGYPNANSHLKAFLVHYV